MEVYNSGSANIYFVHNTVYGNNTDSTQSGVGCGELFLNQASNVVAQNNLLVTAGARACDSLATYTIWVSSGNSTDELFDNFLFSESGSDFQLLASPEFTPGPNNIIGINPGFASATDPGAPNCVGSSDVPDCMEEVIARLTPTAAKAKPYGYQPVSTTGNNPLFPQWICNVNMPSGLITNECQWR